MSANVIQHTKPRRKRAGAWSWATRHIVLLAVVVIAILAASWFAPKMRLPAPANAPQEIAAPVAPAMPTLTEGDTAADLAGPPAPPARVRQATQRSGVPLDAAVTPPDNYEILSADELDAISQARN